MHSSAAISVEDARDLIYDWTASIDSKIAWYLHTDPLLDLTLAKRKPGGEKVIVKLTPEQRVGDWQDFYYKIKPKSMGKLDPQVKAKRMETFLANIVPAILNSAMIALQMGVQYNVSRAITIAAEAEDLGDEIQDILVDPEFQQKLAFRMMMGPSPTGKGLPGTNAMGQMQNGTYPSAVPVQSQQQEFNRNAQTGANEQQSMNQGMY